MSEETKGRKPSLGGALVTFARTHREAKKGQLSPRRIREAAEADARIVKAVSPRLVSSLLRAASLAERFRSFGNKRPRVLTSEIQAVASAAFGLVHDLDFSTLTRFIENRLRMETSDDPTAAKKARKRQKKEELGIAIPWSLVVDVTSLCNITPPCKGCHAAEYPRTEGPSLEKLDGLVGEADELGINTVVFSGGEPLMRELDLQEVMEEHPYLNYAVFTNGTLIGEKTAQRFLDTGAVTALFIHIEGDRKATDKYMGAGSHDRIIRGMDHLKKGGFPFGFAITITRDNFKQVTNEAFLDDLKEKGCGYGIFFPYVPVGNNPKPELMLTDKRRAELAMVSHRANKSGLLVFSPEEFYQKGGGCSAGFYAAVTAGGELQPCVFIHSSDTGNVYEQSLRRALEDSQLIRACQAEAGKEASCLFRDRQDRLLEIVAETGATSTE